MQQRHLLICYHSSAAEPQGQIHQRGLVAALEVLAFALCCPGEAIKTVSARGFAVNDHTGHRDLDQSRIHSLSVSFLSAAAAHSDRRYSLLAISDFQALLGLPGCIGGCSKRKGLREGGWGANAKTNY